TAHSSNLGFLIEDRKDFEKALPKIRKNIHLFGEPVNHLMGFADIPEEIEGIDGYHCIAEGLISKGRQCTLEGYRYQGEFEIYGVVDTIRDRHVQSVLSRYQYPSSVPRDTQKRMEETATAILDGFGYDNAPFNVEFYWDRDSDKLSLLEINARISQSHCPLFALVDGASHQQVVIDLALGKQPQPPHREGDHKVAAKFMMRVFEDGVVAHAPGPGDEKLLEERFPEARFECHVSDGQSLEELPFQDSYSFNIADVYLGGKDQHELLEKYDETKQLVPLEILRRPEIV
ncbi:MAG TPA: D-alanine--D-alanine ligase, partial [Woeseiaceae bacterium]|nr:D-alanine--D-alanine ligase [Woeseiaceae bacterium]